MVLPDTESFVNLKKSLTLLARLQVLNSINPLQPGVAFLYPQKVDGLTPLLS